MAKRGSSGLSLLLALDKPKGITSHDVVNRVRHIFGEKRVGHTGTLDPLASGVLCVAVGPATRLDAYLSDHKKTYTMDVAFGASTSTDDAEGAIISTGKIPPELSDPTCAAQIVTELVGKGEQVPPVYSAVKVGGQKSYAVARKGDVLELEPRPFEVFSATLDSVFETEPPRLLQQDSKDELEVEGEQAGAQLERVVPVWRVTLQVSGGTYIRSIARDLGQRFGCGAFVAELRRIAIDDLTTSECVSLDELEHEPHSAIVDPLRLLGVRAVRITDEDMLKKLNNGNSLPVNPLSIEAIAAQDAADNGFRAAQLEPSSVPCFEGELLALLVDNRIKALYSFDVEKAALVPRCVFPVGVERGTDLLR